MTDTLGPLLTEPKELLHRQVHPVFLHEGRPGSVAFGRTKKDEGLLSVVRSSLATAEQAYRSHVEQRRLPSAGTWSVTVEECSKASLKAYEDPIVEPVNDPAHAAIDFRGLSHRQAKRCAQLLAHTAHERGATYQPSSQKPS